MPRKKKTIHETDVQYFGHCGCSSFCISVTCLKVVARRDIPAKQDVTVIRITTVGWVIDRYFTPYNSVGNTFAVDVVQVTSSNLTSNVS